MALRRLWLFVVAGPVIWAACASSDDESSDVAGMGGSFAGTGGEPTDAPRDRTMIDVVAPSDGPEAAAPLSPLCGSGTCTPDDANSCADFDSGAGGTGTGTDAGMAGQAGAAGASLTGDASPEAQANTLPPPQTGLVDAAYNASPSGSDASGDGAAGSYAPGACRIHRDPDPTQEDKPVRDCQSSGGGAVDAPCVSSSDCRPGLACVGDSAAARCRPLCCAGAESCTAPGTYCTEQLLREDLSLTGTVGRPPLLVPVCVKADDCDLAEPYPCPVDRECKCVEGTACMLVRADGTTSCVKPGEGTAGEACPCAWGHVCSQATSTCLKLCPTSSQNAECGSTGKCQASADLPVGWGVCVGPSDTDGG